MEVFNMKFTQKTAIAFLSLGLLLGSCAEATQNKMSRGKVQLFVDTFEFSKRDASVSKEVEGLFSLLNEAEKTLAIQKCPTYKPTQPVEVKIEVVEQTKVEVTEAKTPGMFTNILESMNSKTKELLNKPYVKPALYTVGGTAVVGGVCHKYSDKIGNGLSTAKNFVVENCTLENGKALVNSGKELISKGYNNLPNHTLPVVVIGGAAFYNREAIKNGFMGCTVKAIEMSVNGYDTVSGLLKKSEENSDLPETALSLSLKKAIEDQPVIVKPLTLEEQQAIYGCDSNLGFGEQFKPMTFEEQAAIYACDSNLGFGEQFKPSRFGLKSKVALGAVVIGGAVYGGYQAYQNREALKALAQNACNGFTKENIKALPGKTKDGIVALTDMTVNGTKAGYNAVKNYFGSKQPTEVLNELDAESLKKVDATVKGIMQPVIDLYNNK